MPMSEEEIINKINYILENWHNDVLQIGYEEIQGLLDLYNKEKEKNKEYERQLDLDYVDNNFISKDKIRNKLQEIIKIRNEELDTVGISSQASAIDILKELLEE